MEDILEGFDVENEVKPTNEKPDTNPPGDTNELKLTTIMVTIGFRDWINKQKTKMAADLDLNGMTQENYLKRKCGYDG